MFIFSLVEPVPCDVQECGHNEGRKHSQSRCFFLGPLTSCVVALHTALLMADPVMLCWAAAMRSVIDWPDMAPVRPASLCRSPKQTRGIITIRRMDQVSKQIGGGAKIKIEYIYIYIKKEKKSIPRCAGDQPVASR